MGGSPAQRTRRVLDKRAQITARDADTREPKDPDFFSEVTVDGACELNDKLGDASAVIDDTSIDLTMAGLADVANVEESPGPSLVGLGSRISDESSIRACSTNIMDGPSELECTDLDCAQLDLHVDSLLGEATPGGPAASREPSPITRQLLMHLPQAPAPTPERTASSAEKATDLQRALDVLDLEVSSGGVPPNSPVQGGEAKPVFEALQPALDRLEALHLEDSADESSIGARRLSGMSSASESLPSPTRVLTFSAQMDTVEEVSEPRSSAATGAAMADSVERRFDEVKKENALLRGRVSALEKQSAEQGELISNMMQTHDELYQIVSQMAKQLEAPPRTAGIGAPPPGWVGDVTTTAAESGFPERLTPVLRRRSVF
jgi:hypothetical protein